MPRKKSGEFDKKQYVADYIRENIKYRKINFNIGKEEDVQMIEWLDSQPEGVSNYLKKLIRADMVK